MSPNVPLQSAIRLFIAIYATVTLLTLMPFGIRRLIPSAYRGVIKTWGNRIGSIGRAIELLIGVFTGFLLSFALAYSSALEFFQQLILFSVIVVGVLVVLVRVFRNWQASRVKE